MFNTLLELAPWALVLISIDFVLAALIVVYTFRAVYYFHEYKGSPVARNIFRYGNIVMFFTCAYWMVADFYMLTEPNDLPGMILGTAHVKIRMSVTALIKLSILLAYMGHETDIKWRSKCGILKH